MVVIVQKQGPCSRKLARSNNAIVFPVSCFAFCENKKKQTLFLEHLLIYSYQSEKLYSTYLSTHDIKSLLIWSSVWVEPVRDGLCQEYFPDKDTVITGQRKKVTKTCADFLLIWHMVTVHHLAKMLTQW